MVKKTKICEGVNGGSRGSYTALAPSGLAIANKVWLLLLGRKNYCKGLILSKNE